MINNNKKGIIYLAINKENNKKYIGATTNDLASRKKDHIQKSTKGVGHEFQHAIWTFGADAFSWIEIDTANSISELAYKEKYYINKYDSFRNGYNADSGGGFKKPIYQYTLSGELVNSFDSLQEAADAVDTNKKTISKTCHNVNQIFQNHYWSYDYREPYLPIKKDKRFKEVEMFDKNNEIIETFRSIAEASRITGIHKSSIAKCCIKERNTAGGFRFKYMTIEKDNNINLNKNIVFNKPKEVRYNYNYIDSTIYLSKSSVSTISSVSTFIYVTDKDSISVTDTDLYTITDKDKKETVKEEQVYAQFAPFFQRTDTISIPKKVKYNLKKYVSRKSLRTIHKDIDIAIEICLKFLSNLSITYYQDNKWRTLNSTILNDQFKWKNDNTWVYSKVIAVLKEGTKRKGPFIEVKKNREGKESYEMGISSKQYKLSDTYLKAGLEEYQLKNKDFIKKREAYIKGKINIASQNVICNNLIQIYPKIELPDEEHLMRVGREHAKQGKLTNKGKRITMRNKHGNSHWKNPDKLSFVEDAIKRYKNLFKNGPRIFRIGNEKSGGRIVDSFTLMSSWIRKECKIDGEFIVEVDYSSLHPNNASKIYGGSGKNLNHDDVAGYLGISRNEAKSEHFKFFNKRWSDMKKPSVFKYYSENEPEMIENIRKDKLTSKYGHKITSRRLLKIEVEIMTKAIKKLNEMGIYIIYVYDALYCHPRDKEIVKLVMDSAVKEMGINTYAKIS